MDHCLTAVLKKIKTQAAASTLLIITSRCEHKRRRRNYVMNIIEVRVAVSLGRLLDRSVASSGKIEDYPVHVVYTRVHTRLHDNVFFSIDVGDAKTSINAVRILLQNV